MLKFTIKLLPFYIVLIQCNPTDDDKLKSGISPGFQDDDFPKTIPDIPPAPDQPEPVDDPSKPNKDKNKDDIPSAPGQPEPVDDPSKPDKDKEEFGPLTDQLIVDDDNVQPCDALQTILYATFSDKTHVSVLNKNRDTPLKQVLFEALKRIHKKEKINRKELLEQFKESNINVNDVKKVIYKLHEILSEKKYKPVDNKDPEYEPILKVFKNPKESLAIQIGGKKYDYKYTTEYSVWTPKHIWGNDQVVKLYEKTDPFYTNPIMRTLLWDKLGDELKNKIQKIQEASIINIVQSKTK